MNEKMSNLISEVENVRQAKNPVISAWTNACQKIGLSNDDPMVAFGLMFAEHPDLKSSTNAYHNQLHAADAVTCAGLLAKEEFDKDELKKNGTMLIFSMLCHDIAHNGGNNQFDYQLEMEAVSSMNQFVLNNPHMKSFWDNNLAKEYGSWKEFSKSVESIILGTDFKNGPKANCQNYGNKEFGEYKLNKLKMLANEADILPSCSSSLGPQLGLQVAKEQNNPGVASWKGREFFLGQLATFGSKASKKLGIQEHINKQLETIKKYSAAKLDEMSQGKNFLSVAEKVHHESTFEPKVQFNLDAMTKMRETLIKSSNTVKNKIG